MKSVSIESSVMTLLLLGALSIFPGCSKEVEDGRGERVGVSGMILLDGTPLEKARIVFESTEGISKVVVAASITNGSYKIAAERGPLVGKTVIRIEPLVADPEQINAIAEKASREGVVPNLGGEMIPARYNAKSELTVNVTNDSEKNVFDFNLENKTKK